jgi:hypothetical protein
MSAAANAAGYLYAHGKLPVSNEPQADAASSQHGANSQSTTRVEPRSVLSQAQSQPVKQVGTPRIEYRKRRFYALPSIA